MAKVQEIVARALRLIQVQDARQPVKAVDMQTGISAMNAMIGRWEANGLSLGWAPVANPSDDMPCPPEAEEAIAANLAITLAPEYGTDVSPVVAAMAARGMSDLRADVKAANPLLPDRGVLSYGYDTRTDRWY
ncbi:hypothetical protein CSC62_05465 [Pseudoxanthomonas jiangsuensis]|uniref:packaged DNA stabilization gp4 family protein n=1 Tax=Pseudoxanthomonas jiangsuensis TaxID=619688 RepID=UPI001391334F|nr:packaged DNA stabilization gp4 family protein [Pseudoxanthomonas jiangsuensis]KAF1698357.1 hypothetical protein CSC62_05465 [Pseudoxanthomonas jiangsuensis]